MIETSKEVKLGGNHEIPEFSGLGLVMDHVKMSPEDKKMAMERLRMAISGIECYMTRGLCHELHLMAARLEEARNVRERPDNQLASDSLFTLLLLGTDQEFTQWLRINFERITALTRDEKRERIRSLGIFEECQTKYRAGMIMKIGRSI